MPELRRLAQELFDRPLVPAPALDDVTARARVYRQRRQLRLTATAVACLLVLSAVVLPMVDADDDAQQLRTADGGPTSDLPVDLPPIDLPIVGGSTTTTAPPPPSTTTTTAKPGTTPTTVTPQHPPMCPDGQNAGATDVGVTATRVNLLVRLRQNSAATGAQAVINKVNREGGVCGRMVNLHIVTDPAPTPSGEFFAALPDSTDGVPAGMPIVGTDGLVAQEYQAPSTWPVGTPAAAQARIVAKHAWDDRASRTFGLVYSQQQFGTEAKTAFESYVQGLGGAVKASIGVAPGKASYAAEGQQLANSCGCDAVVFALDPSTLVTFIASLPEQDGKKRGLGGHVTSALSPVVNERFARDCGRGCTDMLVWTPYTPPVGEYREQPDVAAYVNDVRATRVDADITDHAIERAYIGAKVLVAALQQAGPNLTRARLQSSLDSMTYTSGLSQPLRWTGDRVANTSAMPMRILMGGGSFAGFAVDQGGFRSDPGS